MSHVTTIEFFQALYPDPVRPGRLMLWTRSRKNGKRRSYWPRTLGQAATEAHRQRSTRETFFSVALHDVGKAVDLTRKRSPGIQEPSARGGDGSAVALPALWAEIRIAAGAPPDGTATNRPGGVTHLLPPDREAIGKLLEEISVLPSIIVNAVSSYQVFWLLDELWLLKTREDRAAAIDVLGRLQGALHSAAQANGWWVDHDPDLGHLLRVPDTFNLDWPGGRWIGVVHFPWVKTPGAGAAGDYRYRLEDFAHLPPPPQESASDRLLHGVAVAPGIQRPLALEPILDGCPWLEHWIKNARQLHGEAYHAVAGIVSRCTLRDLEGPAVFHRLSAEHPAHNLATTEEKLALALHQDPPTCRRIAKLEHGALCHGCANFGQIEMPLDLADTDIVVQPSRLPSSGKEIVVQASRLPASGKEIVVQATRRPASGKEIVAQASRLPSGNDTVVQASRLPSDPVPILVTTREHEVNDQARLALVARTTHLFTRCGVLVEVVSSAVASAGDAPVVHPVTEPRMRELLSRHCAFQAAQSPSGPRPLHPPRWVVRALLGRGGWPELPALAGVVECPVLRPDGSVLQQPGYDPESGLLYAPSGNFLEVPDTPDRGAALDALAQLREAVRDFPFETEAHRAAWLCSLLTPLARAAFTGPAPLNLIDANIRGCGKSLLADVCSVLLTGRPAARMSIPGPEAELRKAITSLALEAERMVLLDNVAGVLGSPTLDRALTAEVWRDRVLGTSRQVALPLQVTWYATGNNVSLAGDTARRCLHIRLSSPLARPEQRSDFRHPRLLAWLARERPRLLPAAVTLLRAYCVAGRPRQPLAAWGSYGGWSDLVRSTVVWLGLPDPAATRESSDIGVVEGAVLHDLVFGLAELLDRLGRSATVKQIARELATEGAYPRLRCALAELFPHLDRDQLPSSQQLAGRLRAYRGHVARGHFIDRVPNHHGAARWTVRKVASYSSWKGASHAA